MHVGYSVRAVDAITVLEAAIERHGAPQYIRSDNGPEFIAKAIQDWLAQRTIQTAYIRPGSPWEQAYIESFHDKLRDECLNREILPPLAEARVILEGCGSNTTNTRAGEPLAKPAQPCLEGEAFFESASLILDLCPNWRNGLRTPTGTSEAQDFEPDIQFASGPRRDCMRRDPKWLIAWTVVLWAWYLLLVGQLTAAEVAIGLVAGFVSAIAALTMRRQGKVNLTFRPG
ncbi:MAG: transposase family protein, partial [Verrucomicrobia bacterium]|nr:transposase family protein [Verrucomicrobiota bacterium]